MAGGPRYRAVLLDFRGILVGFRDTEWWARRACATLGREIDADLALALYESDFDPDAWPVYPDAPDLVKEIKARGCSTALMSDFHVDLRPHLEAHGIVLDAYVISFEHGFQKPDPRMFTTALEALGAMPSEALMVGDRASHDGVLQM